ncbi:MAG: YggS family pyridoxal phosphate-dependent enzyme [Chloroflexota bacterium]|nr:YggS family pyridoxal phosphate-dependent enzyme [Chloroflexota bacterium]
MLPSDFEARFERLQERIASAAARAGRNPEEVRLVSVTKSHPPEVIQGAYEAGLRDFGENRVSELLEKQEVLDLSDARWHFVGRIQRRKVKKLIGQSALIHSVDRLSLAQELSKRGDAAAIVSNGLLQVNTSGEESKGGWEVYHPEGRERFFSEVETILALPAIRLHGLMTMAPFYDEPERMRPAFRAVHDLQRELTARFPGHLWEILSMGMTNDFEVAIEEGATHIRVGTALFGPREY